MMRSYPHLLLASVLFFAASANTAHARLTHRYSFNDGSARDSVGAADGVLVNGATVSDGRLVFDPAVNTGFNSNPATGQYLDLPNNIANTRAFTIEAWTTWRGGGNWQRIADFGNNTSGLEILPSNKTTIGYEGTHYIILSPSNRFTDPIAQVNVSAPGGGTNTDFVGAVATPFTQNVQHHVVFGHDPDAGVDALWVDGVLLGESTAEFDVTDMNYVNYWVGRSNFQQDPFYNGTINEFRIYDHLLTANDVAANFARGADVVPEPAGLALAAAAAASLLRRRRR